MDRDRLRACSSEDLVESSIQIAARLSATQAALLDLIAVIDERELWRADGCLSLEDWVSFTYQVSRRTAHEWADAARALESLPHLSAAFASGELSWDKTRAVSVLATSESDAALAEEAQNTDVKHLERAARKARAISLEEANARHRDRFFAMRRSITLGGVRLSGFLPDVDGETFVKAIEQLADEVSVKDPQTGLYPAFDERCADALVEMAASSLAQQQSTKGERAMVVAHVDLDQEPHAETESGMPIATETLRRLLCDSVIEPILEREGRTVEAAKKLRHPPSWMRRQLVHRDEGCRFPGCTRIRGLHAHHIDHFPGPTEPENLVMLCRAHHRAVHEGGWSIRGDPEGGIRFVKPDEDQGPGP